MTFTVFFLVFGEAHIYRKLLGLYHPKLGFLKCFFAPWGSIRKLGRQLGRCTDWCVNGRYIWQRPLVAMWLLLNVDPKKPWLFNTKVA